MAAGKKLGDAWIEVTADASKIGRELGPAAEAQLQDAARKMGDSLDKGLTDAAERGTSGLGDKLGEEGERGAEKAAGRFGEALSSKLDAAIKALPDPRVGIAADLSPAERALRELKAELSDLSVRRIGIDIDAGTALTEIRDVHGRLDELAASAADVAIRVDAGAAGAELAKFEEEVRRLDGQSPEVTPKVDTSFGSALSNASGVGEGALQGLMATAWAVAPALIPIGAAAVTGIGAIGALAAGAAAGLGVLVAGLSGVSGAVKLLTQRQDAVATAAATAAGNQVSSAAAVASAEAGLANTRASNADAAISAAERVAQATLGQADAARTAARNIAAAEYTAATSIAAAVLTQEGAERTLTTALRTQTQAQLDLIQARKDAARQLEDLANQVQDNALAQRGAITDVAAAQRELDAVLANTRSSDAARAAAQLNYDTQLQRQRELQLQGQRLADDQKQAVAKGVDGNAQVVDATQKVADANTAVQLAQAAAVKAAQDLDHARIQGAADVALANEEGAKRILAADQAVSDALRAQTAQARQAAFAVASAQAGIASAMRSAAGSAVSALAGIDTQLAKVDPATRAFADYAVGTLVPAWNDIQGSAAAGVLPGLQRMFEALLPLLPAISGAVGGIAKVIGDLFAGAAAHLSDPAISGFFTMMATTAGPALQQAADAAWNLIGGFANIVTAFAPLSAGVGGGIVDLTKKFADWASGLSASQGFHDFTDYVKAEWPRVQSIIGSVVDTVEGLIGPALAVGAVVLPVLQGIAWGLGQIPSWVLVALITGFVGLKVASDAAGAVTSFIDGVKGIAQTTQMVYDAIKGVAEWVAAHGIAVARVVAGWVIMGVESLIRAAQMAASWVIAMGPIGWIIAIVVGLVALIIANWDTIKKHTVEVFQGLSDFVHGIWAGLGEGLKIALNVIIDTINSIAVDSLNGAIHLINKIPGVKIPDIPHIPHLADGTIVHKATLAVVGEAGPEAVIPLSASKAARRSMLMDQAGLTGDAMSGAGGGGITVDARQTYIVRDTQTAEEVGAVVGSRVVRDVRSGITGRYTQRTAA